MPDIPPPPEHPEVRYEKSDASIGGIIAFGIMLAVLGLIVLFSANWLFDGLKERAMRRDEQSPSHWRGERPHLPSDLDRIPRPRLQKNETVDLHKLRETEESLLTQYGWVDHQAGIVRIPIDEAMKMLADPKIAADQGIRIRPRQENKK